MEIIFTTKRCPTEAEACVKLGEMSEDELLKIMYAYHKRISGRGNEEIISDLSGFWKVSTAL